MTSVRNGLATPTAGRSTGALLLAAGKRRRRPTTSSSRARSAYAGAPQPAEPRAAPGGCPADAGRERSPRQGLDGEARYGGEGGASRECATGHPGQRRWERTLQVRRDWPCHHLRRLALRPRGDSGGRRIGFIKTSSETPELLEDLLGAPAPSGYEGPASDVWRRGRLVRHAEHATRSAPRWRGSARTTRRRSGRRRAHRRDRPGGHPHRREGLPVLRPDRRLGPPDPDRPARRRCRPRTAGPRGGRAQADPPAEGGAAQEGRRAARHAHRHRRRRRGRSARARCASATRP